MTHFLLDNKSSVNIELTDLHTRGSRLYNIEGDNVLEILCSVCKGRRRPGGTDLGLFLGPLCFYNFYTTLFETPHNDAATS